MNLKLSLLSLLVTCSLNAQKTEAAETECKPWSAKHTIGFAAKTECKPLSAKHTIGFAVGVVAGVYAAKIFLRKKDGFADLADCLIKSTALASLSIYGWNVAINDEENQKTMAKLTP